MDSERQHRPPQQPVPLTSTDNNWQYDQNGPAYTPRPSKPVIPPYQPPLQQQGDAYNQPGPNKPLPPRYQEPIADMGTSLGYGQGMEYQYFDVPQPSQPMPQLRMERLQQLRQERMRRDRQHNRPDLTSIIKRKKGTPLNSLNTPAPSSPLQSLSGLGTDQGIGEALEPANPAFSIPPAAAEPAQSTAAIQKVRLGNAALLLSGAFIASRVLGLVRQALFTALIGPGVASAAYLQAFLVPDTIFNIIAGGALSSAFIPVFTRYMVTENDEEGAWHIANTALTIATAFMLLLAILAIIFAHPIVVAYNPIAHNQTLAKYNAYIDLITGLIRIMLWQAVILGAGVIINSVLNARQNFLLPALGTVVYNVGLIAGLFPAFFIKDPNVAIYGAAIGVVIGAALQVAIQVTGLKKVGMHFRPSFDWHHPALWQIVRQMIPRIINAGMFSFTTFIDRYLIGLLGVIAAASLLDGLILDYYQAYQLVMLPLGIIGMAMSTAAFPMLTEYVSRGRMERVRTIFMETLRSILFLSIPSSVGLAILGQTIIQTLLQHGRFEAKDTQIAALSLTFFAIGLAGYSAVEICTRGFYALRDSRTPVIISIGQFVLKIALSLIFLDPFAVAGGASWGLAGLAFATAIASIGEALVLFIMLHLRIGGLFQKSLLTFLWKIAAATAATGIGLFVARVILDLILNTTDPHAPLAKLTALAFIVNVIKLSSELAVGSFIYLRMARILKLEELGPFKRILDRFKLSWVI